MNPQRAASSSSARSSGASGASSAIVRAFEARSRRASLLSERPTGAREVLRFVAGLCDAQARCADALERAHRERPLTGCFEQDADRLSEPSSALRDVARFVARAAPSPLAQRARARADEPREIVRSRLHVFWLGDAPAEDAWLSRALLRPCFELLRAESLRPDRFQHSVKPGNAGRAGRCSFCGGAPSLSVRRGASESDGASRFLQCALCGFEWPFNRILCPACAEADPKKLPSFTDEPHPEVSVEACETCRRYVKSIDLSADGRLLPEVDEVASIALDLWAAEEGFERIETGLGGI